MSDTCPVMPHLDTLPFRTDRTSAWHQVHSIGDVAVSDKGVYFIAGADAVEAAAKNPHLFSSKDAFDFVGDALPMPPIEFDPPEHTRYRHMLDKFFSPRAMAELDPDLRKLAGELIDTLQAAGDTCDIVGALAVPFPSQVFLTLFGLPLEDTDRLIGWKNAIMQFADVESGAPTPEILALATEMYSYVGEYLEKRRGQQGTDLLSLLLADGDEGGMTDAEIIGLCFLFVLAGLDTVTSAVGFTFAELAQRPDLRARLAEDPATIPHFIEEILRVDSPIPHVPRKTTQTVEIGGVTIPAGSTCMLAFGAANRDPERYEQADTVGGKRNNHFAFGRGPHRCLGSHLARLELQILIEEWHKRIPNYSLANGVPQVRWPSATMTLERVDLKIR
jgi:cytochrome P450